MKRLYSTFCVNATFNIHLSPPEKPSGTTRAGECPKKTFQIGQHEHDDLSSKPLTLIQLVVKSDAWNPAFNATPIEQKLKKQLQFESSELFAFLSLSLRILWLEFLMKIERVTTYESLCVACIIIHTYITFSHPKMETRAAPDVENLLICWLLLSDSVLMMEGKVLSRKTVSVYHIAEIVWGLRLRLVVRRKWSHDPQSCT